MRFLNNRGIPTAIYYPKPLHMQLAFKDIVYSDFQLNHSEDISNRIFSIPMHPYLSSDNIQIICNTLIEAKNEL